MPPAERERLLDYRRTQNLPWHSPPHRTLGFTGQYFVTAACYEHAAIIGKSPERLTKCEQQILHACAQQASQIYGWCVLPNHYHVLLSCLDLSALTQALGHFHGRSSFRWNAEDGARGRKVWFRCFDREIRSERHFWATMNYINHNPVHHGLVDKWQDWTGRALEISWNQSDGNAPMKSGRSIRYLITEKSGTFEMAKCGLRTPPKGGTPNQHARAEIPHPPNAPESFLETASD